MTRILFIRHISTREYRTYELYLFEIIQNDKANKCGYRVSIHNGIVSLIILNASAISNTYDRGYIKVVSSLLCSHRQSSRYK